jgi:hypothetical protein
VLNQIHKLLGNIFPITNGNVHRVMLEFWSSQAGNNMLALGFEGFDISLETVLGHFLNVWKNGNSLFVN